MAQKILKNNNMKFTDLLKCPSALYKLIKIWKKIKIAIIYHLKNYYTIPLVEMSRYASKNIKQTIWCLNIYHSAPLLSN